MRWVTRLARLVSRGLPYRGLTPRWVALQLGLAAVVAVPVTGFVLAVLAVTQLGVPFAQLWSLVVVGLLVRWLLLAVGQPVTTVLPATAAPEPAPPLPPYPLALRWERRLSITEGDPEWYTRVVRDRVAAVVTERLRQRHSVTLAGDPGRAARLLGEPLYRYLTEPLDRTPGPAELRQLVSRMEEM